MIMASSTSAPSSTPTRRDDAIFSSDAVQARASSPPSSPPGFPWEKQAHIKPETRNGEAVPTSSPSPSMQPKNVFSILGKRKPLELVTDNARPAKKEKVEGKGKGNFTQMRMSLGQSVQKKCKTCGMEYTASDAEDRKLHDKFHKQNTEGIDVGKEFVSKTAKTDLFKGVEEGDAIVSLWCFDTYHRKKKGQAVLEMVQKELGAVPIPEEDVWDAKRQKELGVEDVVEDPKYRAYLYARGTKAVGFLLVEKIQRAKRVVRPVQETSQKQSKVEQKQGKQTALQALKARKEAAEKAAQAVEDEITAADGQPLQLSESEHSATLGISRIWTSSTHRGQGIAKALLTTAIGHHNRRHAHGQKAAEEIRAKLTPENEAGCLAKVKSFTALRKLERKEQVAFSQPTYSGARLARRWYGKAYGWSVYVD